MSFLRFFSKRKKREYRTIFRGKLLSHVNTLEQDISANIYKDTPPDKFSGLPELKSDMEKVVGDTLHILRLPLGKTKAIFTANIEQIMEIPAIYLMLGCLKSRGLDKFILNCHSLATMFQACACYGSSEMTGALQKNLLHIILGIYVRFFGIQFMKQDEYQSLLITRKFNMSDPKERQLRDDFFKSFKNATDKLVDTSAKRFFSSLNIEVSAGNKNLKPLVHIIQYSSRLMGRTALNLKKDQEQDIHQFASYVGVLYSIVSALNSTNKRLCTLLAEEYDRNRTHHKHEGMEKTARYNIYALSDMLRITRCRILDFFQGKDEIALYNEAENIYVRKMEDGRGGFVWGCFRSEKPAMTKEEREKRCSTLDEKAKNDPSDRELVEIFNVK